jgi:hypothetical protein
MSGGCGSQNDLGSRDLSRIVAAMNQYMASQPLEVMAILSTDPLKTWGNLQGCKRLQATSLGKRSRDEPR